MKLNRSIAGKADCFVSRNDGKMISKEFKLLVTSMNCNCLLNVPQADKQYRHAELVSASPVKVSKHKQEILK